MHQGSSRPSPTRPPIEAERKTLRSREAKEAITDHEEAQRALLGNLERLRKQRLAREAAAGPMLYPAPELPDDTPIENVRFSTRVRNGLATAGMKTVGEIREASDAMLLGLQDLGRGSVAHLRETLGLPSTEGSGPWAKSPPDLLKRAPAKGRFASEKEGVIRPKDFFSAASSVRSA